MLSLLTAANSAPSKLTTPGCELLVAVAVGVFVQPPAIFHCRLPTTWWTQPAPLDQRCGPSRRPTRRPSPRHSRSWTVSGRGRSTPTSSRVSCCRNGLAEARGPLTQNWKHRSSFWEIRRPSMQTYCASHAHWLHTSIRLVHVKHFSTHCFCYQPSVLNSWATGRASGLWKTEWWRAGVVICLERGADLHMAQLMSLPLTVSCFSKIQIGFTFLVLAHLGSPGQRAVKQVCVHVLLLLL